MRVLAASLARVALGQFPTRLEPAPRLSAALGGPAIWIKREDMSGLALGGNKTRQLEVLMAATLAEGADTVVVTAAAQSNFCRTAAAAAAKLGLRAFLLLRGAQDSPRVGNLMLDQVLGAEIEFISTSNPYDPAVQTRLDAIVERLHSEDRRPKLLHVVGATGALAAAAYVPFAEELAEQFEANGIVPTAIYVTAGSGLTMAGLAIGLKALGLPTRVIGVSAQQKSGFLCPIVLRRATETAQLLGLPTTLEARDIEIDDSQLGPGYGIPTPAAVRAIECAARTEALLLDPVYTGKCMAGMIAHNEAGRWKGSDDIVFIHSGGTPGLFAYGADSLATGEGRPNSHP
jgi:1-aminocyclopropane-1-carboxylate deaminase/D-cysteine desulfhydrase-like pyridoxal-dependent ACC family enzyme